VTGQATCSDCHGGTDAATVITDVHSDTCAKCHSDISTDGTLIVGANGWGTAAGGAGNCASCHEDGTNYTYSTDFDNAVTSHQAQDHSGLTGTTSTTPVSNCAGCHEASTKALIVSDTHTDTCTNCHTNTAADGRLVGAGANGYGTTVGHVIGATSNCADCHSARAGDFSTHDHADTTYHAPNGSGTDTTVAQNNVVGGDHSQNTTKPCSDCHLAASWAEIIEEHLFDCATCHNATRNTSVSGSYPDTPSKTIQDIIADPSFTTGSPANCAECHRDKITSIAGADSSHGTHGGNFSTHASCSGCHTETGEDIVNVLHAGSTSCTTHCHSATPNSGNVQVGPNGLGDATNANGAAAGGTWSDFDCVDCHDYSTPDTALLANIQTDKTIASLHHYKDGGTAAIGDCDACHTDPRAAANQIKQLSCRACHIRIDTSTTPNTMYVQSITIAPENSTNANGRTTGNTYTDIVAGQNNPRTSNNFATNHKFSTDSSTTAECTDTTYTTQAECEAAGAESVWGTIPATAIDNYGACHACHGDTGHTSPTNYNTLLSNHGTALPEPFHAMPEPGTYTGSAFVIGGNGYNDNLATSGTEARFRGAVPWQSTANKAIWPAGKGRMNIAYDQHSLIEHATENTTYKSQPHIGSQFNVHSYGSTAINFGKQWVTHYNSSSGIWGYVPHFDATNPGTPDTLSGVSASIFDVGSGGGKANGYFTLTANSTVNNAVIHVLIGGRHMGTFTEGGTFTLNWSQANVDGDAENIIPLDFLLPTDTLTVWLISESGGSTSVELADPRELPKVEVPGNTSYIGKTWPQDNTGDPN
jgi:hypothetical protein